MKHSRQLGVSRRSAGKSRHYLHFKSLNDLHYEAPLRLHFANHASYTLINLLPSILLDCIWRDVPPSSTAGPGVSIMN